MSVRADKTAAADYRAALEDLEAKRRYEQRIETLLEDVRRMEARIRDRDGDLETVASQYQPQLEAAEAEMARVKGMLRALLDCIGEYAEWRMGGDNEVAIYSSLLDFEEQRIVAGTETVLDKHIHIFLFNVNNQRTVTMRQSAVKHEERESYVEDRVSVKSSSSDSEVKK